MTRRLVLGAAICVALSLLATGPSAARLGWLELMLVVGILVVAPMGWFLLSRRCDPGRLGTIAWNIQPVAAASVIGSIFIARGPKSAVLAIPWVICCALAMAGCVAHPTRNDQDRWGFSTETGALALQTIAALMLVAWRGRLHPLGLDDTAIGVGAAYLQFAAFGSTVLASETGAVGEAEGIAVATLLFAIGLLIWVPVAIVGVALLIVACGRLAVDGANRLGGSRSWSSALVWTSFAGVTSATLFGILYGVEGPLGQSWLTSQQALRISIAVAALGYVIPGLFAWFIRSVQGGNVGADSRKA